jgi:hypothetical protein
MRIDINRHGWIDPRATMDPTPIRRNQRKELDRCPSGKSLIALERTEGGFNVDLTALGREMWPVEAIPDPGRDGGLPWYPVEKFTYETNDA